MSNNAELVVIQQLMAEVESLQTVLASRDVHMTTQITQRSAIGDAADTRVAFDVGRWSELNADQQKQLITRLTLRRNDLLARTKPNVVPPNYYTQDERMSRQAIIWFAIFGFIFAATLLSLIR